MINYGNSVTDDEGLTPEETIETVKENSLYGFFFDTNPFSIAVFNQEGYCLKINNKFSKSFNIEPLQIEGGKKYNILTDPSFDRKTADKLTKVFTKNFHYQGETLYSFGKSLLFKFNPNLKRNFTWFKIRAYGANIDNRKVFFVIFEDITYKKDYEYILLQQVNELKILNDIILSANKSVSIEVLTKEIIEKVRDILHFDSGSMYFIEDGGNTASLKFSTRTDELFLAQFQKLDLRLFPYNEVLNNNSPYFFDNYGLISPEISINLMIKSLGIIPLLVRDNIFGIILLANNSRHNFTESKKKVLLSIGHELGTIFEKLNYEVEMRQNEQRYRNIFDNSALGIYQSNPDGSLLNVNPAFARLFKFPDCLTAIATVNDKMLDMYINDQVRAGLFDNVEKSETGTYVLETELKKFDKSTFIGKIIMRSVKNKDNTTVYYEGFIEDVTERKTAEARMRILNSELERRVKERTILLEAANKELESFAYSVSHDLRAPLRAIDGFSQAILEDYGDKLDENGHEYLVRVRKASYRMSDLIDDMLKLSRVTRSEMEKKYFNLSAVVTEILERLQSAAPDRATEFIVREEVLVNADQRLITIALENLLDNAFKFTKKKEKTIIEFGVNGDNGGKTYFIRDNGEGFDMKYYDKLFGVFQRLHNPDDFPGTGIGLATVKRVIHKHGGNIRAESVPGEGTVFYFTLPD